MLKVPTIGDSEIECGGGGGGGGGGSLAVRRVLGPAELQFGDVRPLDPLFLCKSCCCETTTIRTGPWDV